MLILASDLTVETAIALGNVNRHNFHDNSPSHFSTWTRNALGTIPNAFLDVVFIGHMVLIVPPLLDFPVSIGLYPAPFGMRTTPGIIRSVT
jgi:hypothetical protein